MEACCCSSSSAPSASILAAAPDVALRRRIPAAAGGRTPARPLRVSAVMLATAVPRRRGPGVIRAVFERFTERAVKAVVLSQREARGLGEPAVAPRHLLLGLVAEDRSSGGFLSSGINIERAREECRGIAASARDADSDTAASRPGSSGLDTDVPFAAPTKQVFDVAVVLSKNMGSSFVSPEHLAIALFSLDDPTTNNLLRRYVLLFVFHYN